MPAAVDNNLADTQAPLYINGDTYAEVDQRYGIDESRAFINWNGGLIAQTNAGGPVSSEPLSNIVDSHGGLHQINGYGSSQTVIVSPILSKFTADDVFKNPKSWSKENIAANAVEAGKVVAEFTPHVNVAGYDFPVQLQVVEKLFGVDHFNWRQTETAFPADFNVQRDLDGNLATASDRENETAKHIDPIQSPVSRYVLTSTNPVIYPPMRNVKIDIQEPPDTLEYYWNENTGGQLDVMNPQIRKQLSLHFEDKPSLPLWYDVNLNPRPDIREYREYRTELVGVKPDGTPVETGLGFTWKSDAKYYILPGAIISGGAEIVGYSASFNNPNIPDAYIGGVYDIQAFTIPEPSGSILCVVAILLRFVWIRQCRTR